MLTDIQIQALTDAVNEYLKQNPKHRARHWLYAATIRTQKIFTMCPQHSEIFSTFGSEDEDEAEKFWDEVEERVYQIAGV